MFSLSQVIQVINWPNRWLNKSMRCPLAPTSMFDRQILLSPLSVEQAYSWLVTVVAKGHWLRLIRTSCFLSGSNMATSVLWKNVDCIGIILLELEVRHLFSVDDVTLALVVYSQWPTVCDFGSGVLHLWSKFIPSTQDVISPEPYRQRLWRYFLHIFL